jgi:hypothetical protein
LPDPARCVCASQGGYTRCGQSCSRRGISGACSRARGGDSSVSNCGSSDCLDPNPALGAAAQPAWMPGTPWQPPPQDTQTHRHTDIAADAVPAAAARSRSQVVMGLHERSEQASGGRCTALPHPILPLTSPGLLGGDSKHAQSAGMGFPFHLDPSRNTSALNRNALWACSTHCWQVLRVVGKRQQKRN